MSIIPLIVGSILLSVGLNIIFGHYKFKKTGIKVRGLVKAIEKYTSITTTNGQRSKSVSYSPIIHYNYNDKPRILTGMGTNEIRYKLNQCAPIMVMASNDGEIISARIDDNMYYMMGVIFSIVGIIALIVYLFAAGGSAILTIITALTAIAIGFVTTSMVINIKGLATASENRLEPHENSVLIETKADYIKEISSHSFWGNAIAYIFMISSIGILYAGYKDLPAEATQMIFSDFNTFFTQLTNGNLPSHWEKPLMLCGIGMFFFLASLRSVYYIKNKYGGMMRM